MIPSNFLIFTSYFLGKRDIIYISKKCLDDIMKGKIFRGVVGIACTWADNPDLKQIWSCTIRHTPMTLEEQESKLEVFNTHSISTSLDGHMSVNHNTVNKSFRDPSNTMCILENIRSADYPLYTLECDEEE